MSMTRAQIKAAQAEARRFIKSADAALAQLDKENQERRRYNRETKTLEAPPAPAPGDYSYGSAATGALRRHSMDLTRTLAALRRPNNYA